MEMNQEEYEIQFYDFSVTDLAEQSKQMLEEVVANTVRAALTKVHKNTAECDEPKEEDEALDRVIAKIKQRISKNMPKYEDLLQKHLSIPDYVILPDNKKHDLAKNRDIPESDVINMQIQSKMLEAEVAETARAIRSLEEELARYEKMKQAMSDAESMFEILSTRMEEDLQTTAQRKSIKHIESIIAEKNDRCK